MIDSTWNRLNLLMEQGHLNTSDRINLLLNAGRDVLEMDLACLTRRSGDYLQVTYATHAKWVDQRFILQQSMCQFTVQENGIVGNHDLRHVDWEEHGILDNLQFGAYLSTSINADAMSYGTLFFARATPRQYVFGKLELAYIEMLVNFLQILLRQQTVPA